VENPKRTLRKPHAERERLAEAIAERLDRGMTALGVIFLLLVFADTLAEPGTGLSTFLTWTGWVIWAVFGVEFLARMTVAPSTTRFLKKNWWQALFLVLPFLRFLRLLRLFRVARGGRVVSSAVRVGRSARQKLAGRVAWLAAITAIVILSSSQLLYEFGGYEDYGRALHDAAHGSITGQPLTDPSGFAGVLGVALAIYSVVVFAGLAAGLGAYFLEQHRDPPISSNP
jgi:voltage-gated potassium channel